MKHLLLTTIAAVLLVGCGESQQLAPAPEAKPVEPVAKVPSQPSPPPAEVKPVAEAAKPEPPTQNSATIYSDKCRFLVQVPNMDQVWEWGVTGANTCEYSWMVRIKAGDKVYELGYSFFNPNSRKQKGTFKELLKVGQTNMWLLDGGGASYVEGVYVNANTEGEFLVLELNDKAWTERLFKERPETVSIQIGGSELNKSESEVRVQYFAEEATADLLRKHGGKTGEELKAAGNPTEPVAEVAKTESPTQKENHKKICFNQLKQIDGRKEMWAVQERRADGDFPTEAQIGEYFRDGMPSCPDGGAYTIGAVGNQASCSIHGKLARPDIQTRDEKPVATGNINPEMPKRSIPRRPRRIPQR